MPEKIQRIPPGLLSQLGIVGPGNNPSALSDLLAPVMSVEHLYAANDVRTVQSATTTGAAGGGASISVPSGFAWRLYAVGCVLQNFTAAGDVASACLFASPPGASTSCPFAFRSGMVSSAGAVFRFGAIIAQPLVLMPGSILQAQLEISLAGGTVDVSIRAIFQQLTV